MTVSVDAVVMFHPLRASAADALADRIGARLVGDPSPELPPSVPGTWRTARAAWASVGEGRADYGLVVQDDVVVCPGFRALAERVLALHAGRVVTFFARASIVEEAFAAGAAMTELPWRGWLMSQAVALPGRLARQLVAAGDAMEPRLADDVRLERWLRQRGRRALATVPSLADHDPAESPLVAGHRPNADRGATLYVGNTGVDPMRIDWAGPIHPAPRRRRAMFADTFGF